METICKEDQSVLPTINATHDVFFYTSPLTQQPAKTDVVRWLKATFQFGIFITIQPTPQCPMVDDDMKSRLREIDFWNNKRWFANRFRRFSNRRDRFLMVGFFHNGHKGKRPTRTFDPLMRHLHLLVHCPYDQMNDNASSEFKKQMMIKNELTKLWLDKPNTWHHNDIRPIPPMHIETIKTKKDADRLVDYCTREMPKTLPREERKQDAYYFFCDE